MDGENWTIGVFVSLLLISYALAFKLGVWKERSDYTAAFAHQVEESYWEGFKDGKKS